MVLFAVKQYGTQPGTKTTCKKFLIVRECGKFKFYGYHLFFAEISTRFDIKFGLEKSWSPKEMLFCSCDVHIVKYELHDTQWDYQNTEYWVDDTG